MFYAEHGAGCQWFCGVAGSVGRGGRLTGGEWARRLKPARRLQAYQRPSDGFGHPASVAVNLYKAPACNPRVPTILAMGKGAGNPISIG